MQRGGGPCHGDFFLFPHPKHTPARITHSNPPPSRGGEGGGFWPLRKQWCRKTSRSRWIKYWDYSFCDGFRTLSISYKSAQKNILRFRALTGRRGDRGSFSRWKPVRIDCTTPSGIKDRTECPQWCRRPHHHHLTPHRTQMVIYSCGSIKRRAGVPSDN